MDVSRKVITSVSLLLCFVGVAFGQTKPTVLSGEYSGPWGNFMIAINNNKIIGEYCDFDQYDEKLRTYMRQNVFTFNGSSKDGKTFKVNATSDPSQNEVDQGTIIFANGTMKVHFATQNFDSAVEFTGNDEHCVFSQIKAAPYKYMGWVKSEKAKLYNYDGISFTPRKGYLVKSDRIFIIQQKGAYYQIGYKTVFSDKITDYWISVVDCNLD